MNLTIDTSDENKILMTVIITCLFFMAALYLSRPHFMPASKIETGTVVERGDSVTTIIIPDKL